MTSLFTDGRTSGRKKPTLGHAVCWDQAPRGPLLPAQGSPQHSQDFFQYWAKHDAGSEGLGCLVVNLTRNQAEEGKMEVSESRVPPASPPPPTLQSEQKGAEWPGYGPG